MSAASDQRDRAFAHFADEESFPTCYARLVLPDHTECTDIWGGPCHPRGFDSAHVAPATSIRNRIRGMKQNPRMSGHPMLLVPEDEVVYDWRIIIPLCPGAHEPWDKKGVRCAYDELPEQAREWAEDYWMVHWLQDLYPASDELRLAA